MPGRRPTKPATPPFLPTIPPPADPLPPPRAAQAGINAVALIGEGSNSRLIAGTFNSQIAMWHIGRQALEVDTTFGGDAVLCMAAGAGGTRLAVGGAKSRISLYAVALPVPGAGDEPAGLGAAPAPAPAAQGGVGGVGGGVGTISELLRLRMGGPIAPILSLALDEGATLLCAGGESKVRASPPARSRSGLCARYRPYVSCPIRLCAESLASPPPPPPHPLSRPPALCSACQSLGRERGSGRRGGGRRRRRRDDGRDDGVRAHPRRLSLRVGRAFGLPYCGWRPPRCGKKKAWIGPNA